MNNTKINYKIFGRRYVNVIIEMALAACMGEWIHIAKELYPNNGVLLYERAGINNSQGSLSDRTPINIAQELRALLQHIKHEEKIIIIAHSQGGLYAQQFTRLYPDMVKGLQRLCSTVDTYVSSAEECVLSKYLCNYDFPLVYVPAVCNSRDECQIFYAKTQLQSILKASKDKYRSLALFI